MAQLTVSSSTRRAASARSPRAGSSARESASNRESSASRVASLDPLAVLASLAADCRVALLALTDAKKLTREAEALRQAGREIAVLMDACGADPARQGSPSSSGLRSPARALGFVTDRYRAALRAPLPRAIREALRAQLAQLDELTTPARAA